MNYSEIKYFDISNGPGIRTSLFVSGCRIHCKGCFNHSAWDFNSGNPFTDKVESDMIDSLFNDKVSGLSILGGEPMDVLNQEVISNLISKVKLVLPNKTIWLWTGYNWDDFYKDDYYRIPSDQHTEYTDDIINNIDVIVTGPYDDKLGNLNLQFRGSENQVINKLDKGRIIYKVSGTDKITSLYK